MAQATRDHLSNGQRRRGEKRCERWNGIETRDVWRCDQCDAPCSPS